MHIYVSLYATLSDWRNFKLPESNLGLQTGSVLSP